MGQLKIDRSVPTRHKFESEMSVGDVIGFATRPGRQRESLRHDRNLPVEKPRTVAKPRSMSKR